MRDRNYDEVRGVRPDFDQGRELAVIIGAGKTGRGFLARLLASSPYQIVFIDKNKELVRRLNQDGSYGIHFFGGKRPVFPIKGVIAFVAGSDEAAQCLERASVILTAVGETNLPDVTEDIIRSLAKRPAGPALPIPVLVCENGASPAAVMRRALNGVEVAEAAIFCSTIELPGAPLDMQSEAFDELPCDAKRYSSLPAIPGLVAVPEFPTLLKRKIYTYNCFSACLAYLGAFKGHHWLADAANDEDIGRVVVSVARPLNLAIAKAFNVSAEEQERFSDRAIAKFKDQNIRDDIPRNARAVARKLGPTDRLISPARFVLESGGDISGLALTIAAALCYDDPTDAEFQKRLVADTLQETFCRISGCGPDDRLTQDVVRFYGILQSTPSISFSALLANS